MYTKHGSLLVIYHHRILKLLPVSKPGSILQGQLKTRWFVSDTFDIHGLNGAFN